jgi:spore coat protein U-like protein
MTPLSIQRVCARLRVLQLIVLSLALLGAPAAFAQSCSAPTVSTLAFGDVTSAVLAGGSSDSTASFSYNCTGFTANAAVRVCITLGSFTSGVRQMTGTPSGTLDFQAYTDASYSLVWGNAGTAGTTIKQIDTTASGTGVVSGSTTIYGRVLSGQNADPPASYSRTMSGANTTQAITAMATTVTSCATISSGNNARRTFNLTADATISAQCGTSATNLNFGNQNNLSANRDQTSTITTRCTNSTPYNIGLDAGTGSGATVTTRKLTGPSSNTINYSLYRDASRTLVWGTTINTNTVAATGSGADQSQTVYGRIPVQAIPNPGTYSDTIVLTVTY